MTTEVRATIRPDWDWDWGAAAMVGMLWITVAWTSVRLKLGWLTHFAD
ncbi:hypothetical protein [Aureliella helgolandensis]|nr:hypothetical protein [Aureliella helgolandensis]